MKFPSIVTLASILVVSALQADDIVLKVQQSPNGLDNWSDVVLTPGSLIAGNIDAGTIPSGESVFYRLIIDQVAPPPPIDGLVINEVDYDQPGSDTDEFVEIYNASGSAIDLTNIALVLINGNNDTDYNLVDLSPAGSLPAGGYLVVANPTVVVDPGATTILFAGLDNNVQNGAPDGLALINTATGAIADVLSYEGEITAATVTGITGTINLVEGTATTAADTNAEPGSIARNPNGSDTNNAIVDWAFTTVSTPGAENIISTPPPPPPPPTGGLVINEVDYDQPGSDGDEFVEIYNASGSAFDLTGISLVLVNGSNNTEYNSVDLSPGGVLPVGGYLVVASSTVTVAPGAITVLFANASNNVQNGPPDGLAIVNVSTETVLDALSYEGEITAANITGFTLPQNLVEGTATPAFDLSIGPGSMIRNPNGLDTGDANTDWAFSQTLTPGSANVLTP